MESTVQTMQTSQKSFGHGNHANQSDHAHPHTHAHTKAVLNRLSKASGHMKAIERMVEDNRSVQEILPQLMAVKSAINNTGKIILADHMDHCVYHAVEDGDVQAIAELKKAIRRFSR